MKLFNFINSLMAPKGEGEGDGGGAAPKKSSMIDQVKKYQAKTNKEDLEKNPAELIEERKADDEAEDDASDDPEEAFQIPEDGDPAEDDSENTNPQEENDDDETEEETEPEAEEDDEEEAEEEEIEKTAKNTSQRTQQETTTTPSADPDDELAELLFKDPKLAINKIRTQVKQELSKESQDEKTEKKFWKDFYKTNPDLSDFKDVVNEVVLKNSKAIGSCKTTDDISKLVKEKSREHIDKLRQRFGNRGVAEKLPKGGEKILSSSGQRAPKAVKTEKAKSFAEQVRSIQRRGQH
jgi:hypothetical protein